MERVRVTFRTTETMRDDIDKAAKDDHRDRNSMLNKMVDFYLETHPKNGKTPTPPRKKAGAR